MPTIRLERIQNDTADLLEKFNLLFQQVQSIDKRLTAFENELTGNSSVGIVVAESYQPAPVIKKGSTLNQCASLRIVNELPL